MRFIKQSDLISLFLLKKLEILMRMELNNFLTMLAIALSLKNIFITDLLFAHTTFQSTEKL